MCLLKILFAFDVVVNFVFHTLCTYTSCIMAVCILNYSKYFSLDLLPSSSLPCYFFIHPSLIRFFRSLCLYFLFFIFFYHTGALLTFILLSLLFRPHLCFWCGCRKVGKKRKEIVIMFQSWKRTVLPTCCQCRYLYRWLLTLCFRMVTRCRNNMVHAFQ